MTDAAEFVGGPFDGETRRDVGRPVYWTNGYSTYANLDGSDPRVAGCRDDAGRYQWKQS